MTTEAKKTEETKAPAKTAAKKSTAKRTRKKTVVFVSPYPDLRIIKDREYRITDPAGNPIKVEKGHSLKFENGRFSTDDAEIVKFLREHGEFKVSFNEVGEAPEVSPTAAEQYLKIGQAAGQLNVDALAQLIEDEETNHNRTPILEAADAALEEIASSDAGSVADDGVTSSTSPS